MPCSNQDTIYENSNKDNNKYCLSERWSITRWPGTARVGDGNSNVFTQQALHYLPNKSTPGWVAFLQSPSTYVQLFRSLTDYRIPRIPRRLWLCPQWCYYRHPAFSGACSRALPRDLLEQTENYDLLLRPSFEYWRWFVVVLEMLISFSTGLLRGPEVFVESYGSRGHGNEYRSCTHWSRVGMEGGSDKLKRPLVRLFWRRISISPRFNQPKSIRRKCHSFQVNPTEKKPCQSPF